MDDKQIIIYTAKDGSTELKVQLEEETIWATQKEMAILFDTTPQNITLHIKNIYAEGELSETSTCKESLQVQIEGEREVKRLQKLYSLDVIISTGYRINSQKATWFRQWATRILKDYTINGYAINQRRLEQKGYSELEQAVDIVSCRERPKAKRHYGKTYNQPYSLNTAF